MTQDGTQNALLALVCEGHGGLLVTMVRDHRLVLRLRVEHAYGIPKGTNRG
jgi:hypothetical protein